MYLEKVRVGHFNIVILVQLDHGLILFYQIFSNKCPWWLYLAEFFSVSQLWLQWFLEKIDKLEGL